MTTSGQSARVKPLLTAPTIVEAAERMVSACLVGLLVFILVLLPRGLDFSDTGFYYNSIFNLPQIDMQTTQYSVVWRLFAFTDLIAFHRLLKLFTLVAAAFLFIRSAHHFVQPDHTGNAWQTLNYLALATIAIIPLYAAWLPDPSYNSLGYTLLMLIYALGLQIAGKLRTSAKACRAELIVAGALSIPLLWSRVVAPVFVLATVLPLILLAARPSLNTLVRAFGWYCAGLGGYLLLQSTLVEPPWITLERMQGGLIRREILNRGDVLGSGLTYLDHQLNLFLARYKFISLASALLIAQLLSWRILPVPVQPYRWRIAAGIALALLTGLAIQSEPYRTMLLLGPGSAVDFSLQGFIILVATGLGLLATCALALAQRSPLRLWLPQTTIVGIAMVLGIAAFFGTSNGWLGTYFRYSGILLSTFCVIAMINTEDRKDPRHLIALASCLALSLLPLKSMWEHPYRLTQPISAQTEAAPDARGARLLRVDATTRDALAAFAKLRATQPPGAPRRALIDLSGQLPLAAFLLQADTPRSGWVLAGYPGSQALFDHTYGSIPLQTLENAWILEAPSASSSLSPTLLNRRGLDFPDAYVPVALTWSEYLKSHLVLWQPRNDATSAQASSLRQGVQH